MSIELMLVLLLLFNKVIAEDTCTYRSIRIFNNNTEPTFFGELQMCNSYNRWESICSYNWNCNAAIVACRQLGLYTSSNRIKFELEHGPTTRFGFAPFSYCSSSYSSLSSCSTYPSSYRNNPAYCDLIKNTVGLNCSVIFSECTSGSVRLVNNQTSNLTREGRIEYCHNGKWSPICTRHTMSHITAYNLCFELGYRSNSFASVFRDGRFGRASSQNWFQYISCSSRNLLSQCSFYSNSCPEPCSGSYHHYGIRCHDPVSCTEGSIRLVNGTVLNEGRLEVCTNGVWGSVCSSSFGSTDAIVVCRELGYSSGGSVNTNSVFGSGDGPIVYSNIRCVGYEQDFNECPKTSYLHFTCERTSLVGVSCWDGCTEGDVRLTGGNKLTEGTVEICIDHTWGLISQVGWKQKNSQIVCDQLGYENEDSESVYDSMFGKPNRTVYLTNVNCEGLEDKLIDCSVGVTYSFDAGKLLLPHVQVIGVRCQGNETYRTLGYHSISISSVHHLNTTGSITITPHITDGLSQRENAVLGVGGTMIIIAIIAIITVIILVGCLFITRKAKNSKSQNTVQHIEMSTTAVTSNPHYVNNSVAAQQTSSTMGHSNTNPPPLPSSNRNVQRVHSQRYNTTSHQSSTSSTVMVQKQAQRGGGKTSKRPAVTIQDDDDYESTDYTL